MEKLPYAERIARIQLYRTKKIGPVTYDKLLRRFGSAVNALENLHTVTSRYGKGLRPEKASVVEQEMDKADAVGAEIIVDGDDTFPEILKKTDGLPPVLYTLGHKHLLRQKSIAIVGGRSSTTMAQKYAYRMAEVLGENDILTVSGMARGIDSYAHRGSLKTGTIAVLAGGIDVPYPAENIGLYEEIKNQGCVISEMPIGTKPSAQLFPVRNRIIAGLAMGTLVVEAEIHSGSLTTAKFAGDMGRDVFAVPGSPINEKAQGCNKLIKEGAILTETPQDIIQNLSVFSDSSFNFTDTFSPAEVLPDVSHMDASGISKDIINALIISPMDIDRLIRTLEYPAQVLKSVLLELELSDIISYSQTGMCHLLSSKIE